MNRKLSKKVIIVGVAMILALLQPLQVIYAIDASDIAAVRRGLPGYDPNAENQCSGAGGANLSVSPAFNLGTEPQERRSNLIRALMSAYQLSAEQAAGVVGNFMVESGGEHLPPDVNEGETTGAPPKFSGGYGWAQWTASRQRTFIDFAVASGYMASESVNATDAANFGYLKKELDEGYQTTITELKNQSTPEDAAVSWEATFEKAGIPALEKRKAAARRAFDEFTGGGSAAPAGSPSSPCPVAAGAAAIVGDYAFPLLIANKSGVSNPGMFKNGDADLGGHPYTAYDILAPPGTKVAAFLGGTVVSISEDKCPGRLISIFNQESNITVSYLHLSFENHAAEGDVVVAGQEIGLIGSAANGCGTPHLHIDAVNGNSRPPCARETCLPQNKAKFVSIGPQLFETFQVIPD